jgi:tripartite-type tricarboxylate transporter receptor subunit TctC
VDEAKRVYAFPKALAERKYFGEGGLKDRRKMFSAEKCFMLAFVAIFCLGISHSGVMAQEKFPGKTIKIFQGSAAGGTTDLASRMFASLLTESFGVPVISVAKIGGANTIAADEVAHAKPDGYTVGYSPLQALTVSPLMLKSV